MGMKGTTTTTISTIKGVLTSKDFFEALVGGDRALLFNLSVGMSTPCSYLQFLEGAKFPKSQLYEVFGC